MALELFWSKRADKKFDRIISYLRSKWDEKVVRSFIKKVYIFLDILVEFPTIGTLENSEKGIRGYSILKQISIFYKIEGHNIILLDNSLNQ